MVAKNLAISAHARVLQTTIKSLTPKFFKNRMEIHLSNFEKKFFEKFSPKKRKSTVFWHTIDKAKNFYSISLLPTSGKQPYYIKLSPIGLYTRSRNTICSHRCHFENEINPAAFIQFGLSTKWTSSP